MPVLGITGGLATGKTTFTRLLRERIDADLFDADACARALLDRDPEIREKVRVTFGATVFDADGKPNRERLRQIVFSDGAQRKALEAILHPAIRTHWTALAEAAGKRWLFVDIPLLFETGAEPLFDCIAVVACSPAMQRRRLTTGRGVEPNLTEQMLAAQLPIDVKIQKANHLVWNESSLGTLEEQAGIFAAYLSQRHG